MRLCVFHRLMCLKKSKRFLHANTHIHPSLLLSLLLTEQNIVYVCVNVYSQDFLELHFLKDSRNNDHVAIQD